MNDGPIQLRLHKEADLRSPDPKVGGSNPLRHALFSPDFQSFDVPDFLA
jgi:hypothetical protein